MSRAGEQEARAGAGMRAQESGVGCTRMYFKQKVNPVAFPYIKCIDTPGVQFEEN